MEPIKVTCSSHTEVELDALHPIHAFKKMSDSGYAQARNSIVELGFTFPFFVWIAPDGTKYTLDGNTRIQVLKRMRDEGFTIPPLPADIIQALDITEAKKKLLACESRYAEPDGNLFGKFLDDSGIDYDAVVHFTAIPGLAPAEEKEKKEKKKKKVTCPNCSTQFEA